MRKKFHKILPTYYRSGVVTPTVIGPVISNDFIQANWTEAGTPITNTFNGSTIRMQSTAGDYSSLIRYNKWFSQAEKWTRRTRVTVNLISGSTVYIGIGMAGVSTFSTKSSVRAALWCRSDGFGGLLELYYGGATDTGTNRGGSVGRLSIAQGDTVELELTQDGLDYTYTARKIIGVAGELTINWSNTNAITYPGSIDTIPLSVSQPAIWNYYGDYTIIEDYLILDGYKNINLLTDGDSKTDGAYCTLLANRYSNQWALNNPGKIVQVSAGSGNVTQDVINSLPEVILQNPSKVILYIGRNDVANAVPALTWQANYAYIVATLEAEGIEVWHQMPTTEIFSGPGPGIDQSTLATYISSTYSNLINEPPLWNAITDNNADGIHPTTGGNLKIYNEQASTITI